MLILPGVSQGCRALSVGLVLCVVLRAQVPSGFADELVAGGLNTPVALDFLPDGRVLVLEQLSGQVKVLVGTTVATLGTIGSLSPGPEQGLLGLAVDPGWPQQPYLYIHYTYGPTSNIRISRFSVSGDLTNPTSTNLTLGGEYIILGDIPDSAPLHNGGTVRFGPDGMLYVSLGDDNVPCNAQILTSLNGRILRIDVQGLPAGPGGPPPKSALVPLGNPFTGPDDNARLTWVMGLRNPFRFHVDPATGDLFTTDVGNTTMEEVNVITQPGLNFGWPWFEGTQLLSSCPGVMPNLTAPVVAFDRTGVVGPTALISLAFYRNVWTSPFTFGPSYEGSYFYLEYYSGVVRRLTFDGSQWVAAPQVPGQPNATDWAVGLGFVSDGAVGPDGRLYYVRQVTGDVRAIRKLSAGGTPGHTLSIVSGNNQVGTSGQQLPQLLVVKFVDPSANPVPGVPISFQVTPPQGVLGQQVVVTDANGIAATSYVMASTFSGNPVITASEPGGSVANFQEIWRGLTALVTNVGAAPVLFLQVRHSQTSSPFSLALDAPGALPTFVPGGLIWTSILNPSPSLVVLDGLGLVGPASPFYVTGVSVPTWELTFTLPPGLNGVILISQAYAVDTNLLPSLSALMISNPQLLTF